MDATQGLTGQMHVTDTGEFIRQMNDFIDQAKATQAAGHASPGELSSPETANRVLAFLMDLSHDDRAAASQREIAHACHIGLSTAQRAVKRLIAAGDLAIERKGSGADYPTVWQVRSPEREA
jgi:DNA-binding MarR family transcriptional regulator